MIKSEIVGLKTRIIRLEKLIDILLEHHPKCAKEDIYLKMSQEFMKKPLKKFDIGDIAYFLSFDDKLTVYEVTILGVEEKKTTTSNKVSYRYEIASNNWKPGEYIFSSLDEAMRYLESKFIDDMAKRRNDKNER